MVRLIAFDLVLLTALLLAQAKRANARFGRSSSLQTPLSSFSLLSLRGGSTTTASTTSPQDDLHAFRLQQQLYLQSRSLQLRQALIHRGLHELQHSEADQLIPQMVDWDCALATKSSPKSCLYSFDAETNTKVVSPLDTEQWITLTALNRLRRNDPTKVEPLWHSQYQILQSWFGPTSPYSLYTQNMPVLTGTVLCSLLDSPYLLAGVLGAAVSVVLVIAMPVWEGVATVLALNPIVWLNWHQWARFVHAALPLKLLLAQMIWKVVAGMYEKLYIRIRARLVECECQMLEKYVPITIVEGAATGSDKEGEEDNEWIDNDDE